MYEQIFHFDSRPFTATPYIKHYFAGEAIDQSLTQAKVCIDRGSGPVIVVGATGTGKSLFMAMLEEQYQSQYHVVNLGCARLDERRQLLQSVLYELRLPFKDLSEAELRFSLNDYLKPSDQCPNGILLLVDEAQSLSIDMMDEIRLITNFVCDGQPRVRLVLSGSQRLEENLNASTLESFNQRIAARCYLGNMSRDETARYVIEHIDRAGGDGTKLFCGDSLRAIHDVTDGCPRLINQVCDHALILAATRAENEITGDCIQEAWADVQSIPGSFKSATASGRAPDMVKNEDWTVIEFGQLDDEDAESEQDTVSDNGNVTPTDDAMPEETMHERWDANQEQHREMAISNDGQEIESCDINEDQDGSQERVESGLSVEAESEQEPELLSESDYISKLSLDQSQILEQVRLDQSRLFGSASESDATDETHSVEHDSSLTDAADDSHNSEMQSHTINAELGETNSETQIPAASPELSETVETVDPFDETFAEEENLIDRYAKFVANQNQSSLTVTSEELSILTPIDELQQSELDSPAIFESDQPACDSPADREDSELSDDFHSIESPIDSVQLDANMPVSIEETPTIQDEPINDSDTGHLKLETQDVQIEAQRILNRLHESQFVSCETPADNVSNEQIEDNHESRNEENVAAIDYNNPLQVQQDESEFTQQNAALEESQQILNEILEQRHALAKQRDALSSEHSIASVNSNTRTGEQSNDDQEMIIVSRMEQQSESPALKVEEQVPFPSTPVSTGRAERMDYQKLFDQLRETSVPNE